MAVRRFYVGEGILESLHEGAEIAIGADLGHRVANVLRMQAGERVALFGGGREFEAELLRDGRATRARLLGEVADEPPRTALTLYQALIRPNRFEWLLEKATELGVGGFVPLITEHTSHQPADIGASRRERWRRITIEASEQCGRRVPPSIAAPAAFSAALPGAAGVRVMAWEDLRFKPESREIPAAGSSDGYSLFVGPEGGWGDGEIRMARAAGALFLGLGPTVLRSETAAVAASALLLLSDR